MVNEEPWYGNEQEGNTLRKIISDLTKEYDELTDGSAKAEMARSIAYLAVQKTVLAKSNKEITERLERMEQHLGLIAVGK